MACSIGLRRHVLVDLPRDLRHRADHDWWRTSHARGMAAHRCATCRRHRRSDGAHLLRFCLTTSVVASSRDCDVQFDYYLRVGPRRAESDSPHNYVARDYQRGGVRLRFRLVFLFQAKRRRLFSRFGRSTITFARTVKLQGKQFASRKWDANSESIRQAERLPYKNLTSDF